MNGSTVILEDSKFKLLEKLLEGRNLEVKTIDYDGLKVIENDDFLITATDKTLYYLDQLGKEIFPQEELLKIRKMLGLSGFSQPSCDYGPDGLFIKQSFVDYVKSCRGH